MKVPVSVLAACFSFAVSAACAQPYTIFLLDVSGSMDMPAFQGKRMDRAKDALVDTLSSGEYPGAELLMWNTQKVHGDYGDGARLAQEVNSIQRGQKGSYLGSAFQSISDAGYKCTHIVFVTDEYPDDQGDFSSAVARLLQERGQNTITVYIVNHPRSVSSAVRFSQVSDSPQYRVAEENRDGSLSHFLQARPAADTCGSLS